MACPSGQPWVTSTPAGVPQHKAPALSLCALPPRLLLTSPSPFLSQTCEGGPHPVRCARAAALPSSFTPANTRTITHTHAWAHHSTTSHCHIRSSVRLCESETEGERQRVWRGEEEGTSAHAAARLQGQRGLCGPRQAASPSCTSLLCKRARTPRDSLPPEQLWGSATKLSSMKMHWRREPSPRDPQAWPQAPQSTVADTDPASWPGSLSLPANSWVHCRERLGDGWCHPLKVTNESR